MGRLYRLLGLLWPAVGWILVWICAVSVSRAADAIVVEAVSGRVFTGQIDRRTSPQALVVRSGTADMYVVRPIDWSRVVRVRLDGKPMSAAELIARFDADGWPSTAEELPPPRGAAPKSVRPPGPSDEFSDDQPQAQRTRANPRVRSLKIEASAGKWSGGVENDGVLLRVMPLDASGNIVPVNGTLEVDLIGNQTASRTRGEPFPQLARWGQQVSAADVGGDGATYRLAYQAWHPEFDLQLGSTAAVHARLSVPGQGVFDDTATWVWVRPYSETRDRVQEHTGARFFPQERTNRGTNDSGIQLNRGN